MTPTAPEITAARERLAARLKVKPEDLEFKGRLVLTPDMPVLMLFNVMDPEHPAYKSTLSVRVGE